MKGKERTAYPSRDFIAGNHDNGADGTVLGEETSGVATESEKEVSNVNPTNM
jgi:hypothetical protein